MSNQYPDVMSPVRVAGCLLKNRIISAPTTIHTASNGEPYPTEAGIRFFEARAKAGAGLVTCAGVTVGGARDDGVHCSWDIVKPNNRNRLSDLAERIHMHGAKCTMELMGIFPDGWVVSDGNTVMGRAMGRGEVPRKVMTSFRQSYIDTAVELKKIGFDGVFLHFGHSIPVAQFLSPLTNRRIDEYGGSTVNRCRYPREIIDGIRAAVGRDFIIDVRISASEYRYGGIDIDEGIRIGEILQENADIIQASAGMHVPELFTTAHPCAFLPPMPNVFLAEALKKSGRIVKHVSATGAIGSISDADGIISAGKADFVVMARAFVADIDVMKKGLEDRQEDVTPCIKCMRCHDSDNYEHHMRCSVNPRVGNEQALERIPDPETKKTVAVIGGGPAGMTAALTAAGRGHKVTLYEKADSLGGTINFADHVPFKYPLAAYRDFLVRQTVSAEIDVKLSTEAKPEDLSGFDAVIAALGSVPVTPPIPGVENTKIATDIFGNESELGENIVIIGGGQVGLETALHIADFGKRVTIVEMLSSLAPEASKTHRDELIAEMQKRADRVFCLLSARCVAVAPGFINYEQNGTIGMLPADTVVLAVGMRALKSEANSFIGAAGEYAEAGDCIKPRSVEHAVREGFYAGLML